MEKKPHWIEWARKFALRHIDLGLAIVITLAGLTLFAFSGLQGNSHAGLAFLQRVEQSSLDLRFEMRGLRPHDECIVIVGIDEKTLQAIGSFPLPRNNYAKLVNQLSAGRARVIAFDVTFPNPESNSAQQTLEKLKEEIGTTATPSLVQQVNELEVASDQDSKFASALKNAGNVLLAHIFLASEPNPKRAEEYFNIVWAHVFPQVLKVNSRGAVDFDMGSAWSDNGGTVRVGVEANITKLAESAASFGFININPDQDGTLRHALLMIRYQEQDFFPSLDLEAVREYEKVRDQDIAAYIAPDGLEHIQFGRHILRHARDGSALINYAGPYHTYQHYSMADVISGAVPPETFRDKIVLIGPTALGLGDIRNTPFANQDPVYMGVEVHANIIDNILHNEEKGRGFLQRTNYQEMADVGFILLFGIGFGLLFSRVTPLYSTILVLLTLAGYGWFVYFGFAQKGQWFSFVIPAGTLAADYAAITSVRMIREEREKRRIRKTFSQYLSPGVIELIEKDPEKYIRPGGEEKELTVLFSDIRKFTTISEGLTPDELVQLLNEYFGQMTDIVFATDGTLDKYIGDAIMAFWGSPYPQADHAFRGCSCALQMVRGLAKLNAKWKGSGRPPISIGIGLNTGLVNVGNMGSARRLSWTVMGDNVNLASRLEGITKEYHVQLIISEATYRHVSSQFVCRELDKIRVKGKNLPVTIYELMDVAAEQSTYEPLLARFDEAMTAYRGQKWSEAAAKFVDILADFPKDGPSKAFLERAVEFSENAPKGVWDGVYVMKTK
ncbi:MAG TPA: adenylate/guanylate cyclase domain-containing protein [Candidatus Sulfotelmatobacter sp.]|nr:adenylate/guanylate cyclase domain-containing protein [Candidatus Sulfotelmatobacter sp.]